MAVSLEQQEANDRLMESPVQDMPMGKGKLSDGREVEGWVHKFFLVYQDLDDTRPDCFNILHLATSTVIVNHRDLQPFGLNGRPARRIAVWLGLLDWRTDNAGEFPDDTIVIWEALTQAYKLRDWMKVELIVKGLKNPSRLVSALRQDEKTENKLAETEVVPYTDTVRKAEVGTGSGETDTNPLPVSPLNSALTSLLKDTKMSTIVESAPVTGQANGTHTVGATGEGETKKRRGRAKDPNSVNAQKKPGQVMRPVADFNVEAVETLSSALQERASLIYAAGIELFAQLETKDQLQFIMQAKIKHADRIKAVKASTGV